MSWDKVDTMFAVALASILALVIFIGIICARYSNQRELECAQQHGVYLHREDACIPLGFMGR